MLGGEGLEDRGELGVAVEAVEGDGGHAWLSGRRATKAVRGAGAAGILPAFARRCRRAPDAPSPLPRQRRIPYICTVLRRHVPRSLRSRSRAPRGRFTLSRCSPPTPNCTACRTSRSCAARRTRRNWSSAPRRWATRRSRSPTSARSRASSARISRRSTPACRSSSAARSRSTDGVKLVLLATDRASYGNLAQLITRGRRNAVKGSYALSRDDVATFADGLLALWVPPEKAGSDSTCPQARPGSPAAAKSRA